MEQKQQLCYGNFMTTLTRAESEPGPKDPIIFSRDKSFITNRLNIDCYVDFYRFWGFKTGLLEQITGSYAEINRSFIKLIGMDPLRSIFDQQFRP